MNKSILLMALAAAMVMPATAKKVEKDPVLLTVGDMKVPVSEFVYLYGKNKSQHNETLTIEEYLPLFINYKLKVADAKNDRVDTTATFKKEFNGYRLDLFRPYLEDKATLDSLINEAYARQLEQVSVSHIMIGKGQTPEDDAKAIALVDSLYEGVTSGKLDFVEVAQKYSMDQSVKQNKGSIGYFTGGRFPYSFESAAFNTPVGQYAPITETKFGRHIIRVDGRRPNPGEVLVRHILLLTQGKDEKELPKIENNIHNLHTLLKAGTDFAELAARWSEDPGTKAKGGELPWFGPGQMVPEFDKVAFELPDSALSEPFQTSYGWHIVQKLGSRAVQPLDQLRDQLVAGMARDERAFMPRDAKYAKLRDRFNAVIKTQNVETLKMAIDRAGRLDSALLDIFNVTPLVFATVDGKEYTCKEILAGMDLSTPYAADMAKPLVDGAVLDFVNEKVVDLEIDRLEREDSEFANLLHEYSDGMLMFEQSNRKVWEVANHQPEQLQAYFEAHRDNYKFKTPKFKGIVVLTANDSITELAKEYIKANNVGIDSLAQVLRKHVNKMIRVEKVLVEKGKNKAVDEDFFGEPKTPAKEGARLKGHFIYEGKLIDAPEEVADVRTQVVTDFQNDLGDKWVEELKAKYPVKVDKKVLKNIKL